MNKSNDDKLYDKIDEYMIIRQIVDEYKKFQDEQKKYEICCKSSAI